MTIGEYMLDSALLFKTATQAAISTAENALVYALTETPVIRVITNGEVKCSRTKNQKRLDNRKRHKKTLKE